MKKLAFDVVTVYEHHDDDQNEVVRTERTKTFYGEENYNQALDYYNKRQQAFDLLYKREESGLQSREEFNGKEYSGNFCEWVIDSSLFQWLAIEFKVRVIND